MIKANAIAHTCVCVREIIDMYILQEKCPIHVLVINCPDQISIYMHINRSSNLPCMDSFLYMYVYSIYRHKSIIYRHKSIIYIYIYIYIYTYIYVYVYININNIFYI